VSYGTALYYDFTHLFQPGTACFAAMTLIFMPAPLANKVLQTSVRLWDGAIALYGIEVKVWILK
jgi:hypothetical protein